MHRLSASFVLGFHGCAKDTARDLVNGGSFKHSTNDYDWLGHGIYFWENDPDRALAFIKEKFSRERDLREPAVVGAIIDLGLCLDVTTQAAITLIRDAHSTYRQTVERSTFKPLANEGGPDLLRRKLDCAVINLLHRAREDSGDEPIDSVKGVFIEGGRLYDKAGFFEKTHIQIAVKNSDCIKGVFWPR